MRQLNSVSQHLGDTLYNELLLGVSPPFISDYTSIYSFI